MINYTENSCINLVGWSGKLAWKSIEKTKVLLNNYLQSAKRQVNTLPENEYKKALEEFLELLNNV